MSTLGIYKQACSVVNNILRDVEKVDPILNVNMYRAAMAISTIALLCFAKTQPLFYVGLVIGAGTSAIHEMSSLGVKDRALLIGTLGSMVATVFSVVGRNPFCIVGDMLGNRLFTFAKNEYLNYVAKIQVNQTNTASSSSSSSSSVTG